jgi:hypothetical protein
MELDNEPPIAFRARLTAMDHVRGLGNLLHHFVGAVGNVLDLPGSSVRDVLSGQNPFDQYLTPFDNINRMSGRGLLHHHGLIGATPTWGNFAGGLATEVATDPLLLMSGHMLLNAIRSRQSAMGSNAIRASLVGHPQMPQHLLPAIRPVRSVTPVVRGIAGYHAIARTRRPTE